MFSLGGWARRFQSGFLVPRSTQDTARLINLTSTGLSPSMDILSRIFLFSLFHHVAVLQPRSRRNGYGLGCADFARHYSRYHFCFLFLLLLRCFSSEGLLLIEVPLLVGCPIRISTDQGLFAPPRSFSQLITSFFALQSLGILRMPLFVLYALVLLFSLKSKIVFRYVSSFLYLFPNTSR